MQIRKATIKDATPIHSYNPVFFRKFGFKEIDKNTLPQKIWGNCLKCPKFPKCEEVAVMKILR